MYRLFIVPTVPMYIVNLLTRTCALVQVRTSILYIIWLRVCTHRIGIRKNIRYPASSFHFKRRKGKKDNEEKKYARDEKHEASTKYTPSRSRIYLVSVRTRTYTICTYL